MRGRSPAPRLLGRALRSSQLAETESSSPPASGPPDKGRPVVSAGDNPNSLYAKVVRLGVEMMVRAVQDIEAGACNAHRLDRKGRLYLNHMFSTGAKRATWHQLESGVIEDYLGSKAERDARVLEAMINPFPESLNTSRRLSAAH